MIRRADPMRILVFEESSFRVSTAGNAIRPTVLAAGYKGAIFVAGLRAGYIRFGSSAIVSPATNRFPSTGSSLWAGSAVSPSRKAVIPASPTMHSFSSRLAISVTRRTGPLRCISRFLLPKLRGFSPTVTALLLGSEVVGVTTTIRPDDGRIAVSSAGAGVFTSPRRLPCNASWSYMWKRWSIWQLRSCKSNSGHSCCPATRPRGRQFQPVA